MEVRRSGYLFLALFGLTGLGLLAAPTVFAVPDEKHSGYLFWGSVLLLLGCGLLVWVLHHKRRAARHDWIFRNGIPGTATVLDDEVKGGYEDVTSLKLWLEVEVPPYEPRQVVRRREYMPDYVAMWVEPGRTIPVYANPKDPEDFILVL